MTQHNPPAMPSIPEDDCDPESMDVAAARARVSDAIVPVAGHDTTNLLQAPGRVLAQDVLAISNVPAAANSAMDGYALRSADVEHHRADGLVEVGKALAGSPFAGDVQPGQCVRIMTGAIMPEGLDTVVMQEHVRLHHGRVLLPDNLRPGQHVRLAGEDIAAGDLLLARGRRLGAADCGLLASQGIPAVTVFRRPRVAYFGTGDELRELGEPLGPGDIHDSSRYTLHALLCRLGVEPLDLGIVPDTRQALREAFTRALEDGADAILSTGGVSVGEADFVKEIFAERGELHFWRIAMKPGRPLAFGKLDQAWFFGLPGNPVSSMVTFMQFVEPALRRLQGELPAPRLRWRATLTTPLKKRPGRTDFQRGIVTTTPTGEATVASTGPQGSGILRSMSLANCFIILDQDQGDLAPGETVVVEPFDQP